MLAKKLEAGVENIMVNKGIWQRSNGPGYIAAQGRDWEKSMRKMTYC